ncbi:hypothetical protein Daura_01545 [Dactylosporangium aurantiacum]|uniref:Uncharacterized protein n=1 Tax=Dactylosporangium aurantiacum TaxID=35754 RepID=A0A9Q9MHM2_9ACTN|nr:hypothetical protein [Dactylosporangium aurantiacum]MDG6100950.1 hypothetical protein [Dactylosporangium aurantiacum]UWZ55000.1 hypothetical protein Daura_01545 [Dactylosporangium aurantiacum]
MGISWRTALGAFSGVVAAVVWAVSLAVHQPFMQPEEFGGNNTYWPRDIRQLAIVLAFLGVVLLSRGVLAGGVGALVWIAADLVLDRFDVHGGLTAVVLALGGVAWFALTSFAALRLGSPGGSPHVLATVAAVCAAVTVLITTPWDEPVTDPAQVQVENALSLLKAGLVVMFAAVALALLPLSRLPYALPFAGLAALAAWPATATYGTLGALGLVLLPAGAAAAVAAARDVSLLRLAGVAAACAVALVPVYLLLYVIGSSVGGLFTRLAGNPPVNSADTDLSLSFAAVTLGLLFAWTSHLLTRPPALVPVGSPE